MATNQTNSSDPAIPEFAPRAQVMVARHRNGKTLLFAPCGDTWYQIPVTGDAFDLVAEDPQPSDSFKFCPSIQDIEEDELTVMHSRQLTVEGS